MLCSILTELCILLRVFILRIHDLVNLSSKLRHNVLIAGCLLNFSSKVFKPLLESAQLVSKAFFFEFYLSQEIVDNHIQFIETICNVFLHLTSEVSNVEVQVVYEVNFVVFLLHLLSALKLWN